MTCTHVVLDFFHSTRSAHTHIHIHIQAFLHAFHLHNNGLGKSKIFFMQSETTATNCWVTCGYLLLPLLVPATRSSTWPSNVYLLSLGSRIAPSPGQPATWKRRLKETPNACIQSNLQHCPITIRNLLAAWPSPWRETFGATGNSGSRNPLTFFHVRVEEEGVVFPSL
jgi:hypothetical protein